MKIVAQYGLFVWISLLVGGCCMLECIAPLSPSRPYLLFWEKPSTSNEVRSQDWIECGGQSNGNWGPSTIMINQEKHPDEHGTDTAYERLSNNFQRCMLKKGYRYIGHCNSQVMKAKPACEVHKNSF